MTELHELLGRDIDPIEDVRRRFETFYTQSYFYPGNGDWMSDDYERIVELTTKPSDLDEEEAAKLGRSINRLNQQHVRIERWLGDSSLLAAYNSVAEQINAINIADPNRTDVATMQPVPSAEQIA